MATVTTTKTKAAPAAKRFQLPALEFKFAPLTEGTDIPPPLPSPIAEEPTEVKPHTKEVNGSNSNGSSTSSKTNGAHTKTDNEAHDSSLPLSFTSIPGAPVAKAGLKRRAEDMPASPTLSMRSGSIRRLFSRNLLNSAYANGELEGQQNGSVNGAVTNGTAASIIRPESRSTGSFIDDRKARRSSGWFRRLRGSATGSSAGSTAGSVNGDSPKAKRTSLLNEEARKPTGPPPPMIPELGELEAKLDLNDEGSLGNDLFKNIA